MQIPWWRSLRTQIAAAVALVALVVVCVVGVVVDHVAAIDARERMRSQAIDRLSAAVAAYEVDGRLRFGAAVGPDAAPRVVRTRLESVPQVSFYDGDSMWAARKLSEGVTLTVELDAQPLKAERTRLRQALGLAGAIGVGLAGLLGWLVAARLSSRLRRAASASAAVAAGDRETRVAVPGHDEVAALSAAVDEMADALALRLEREQHFSADVAHELRTPVTALVSSSELLPEGQIPDLVRSQVGRLRRLVEDLLEISRLESGDVPVQLVDADLGAVILRLHPDAEVRDASVVRLEERRLERIVGNLVANAHKHGAPPVTIRVEGAAVYVEDCGDGYPEAVLAQGPQRFSGLGATKGSGLGLTIAARQAEAIGATLTFANTANGAQGVITLRPVRS